MKFSELWLREWVDIALDSEDLSNQITMAGLKVDSIEPVADIFHGVIIGEVVKCNQESNTDNNLKTIKVNIGKGRLLNIVYNLPNYCQGLKVAVSTVNTVLPDNFKTKIKKSRDKISEGVLCSYSDLGISDDHNIIEFPTSAPLGADIRDYLKLDDNIIEISVTPNRADCLSIIGLARELSILNKIQPKTLNIIPVTPTINDILPIQIEVPNACPQYFGRIVKNINVKMSTPIWMKEKLRRCGIYSINVVVDIINYVMIELGQPIHAFDKDKIKGGVVIRMAKEGETLSLSNKREVKMHSDTLVIADYNRILAIGGIFCAEHSNINDKTKNILLECAFFYPIYVIGLARRYGLYTYESYRDEYGVDPEIQYKAMEYVTKLVIDICGGKAGPVINITNEVTLSNRTIITLRRTKLDRLIGHYIDDSQVNDILHRLGCNVIAGQNQWQVVAPSWRFDIEIEEDLIEEVARIYGYNNIPGEPIQANLVIRKHRESDLSLKRVKTLLNDKGYQEVITYSFIDPKIQQIIHPGQEALILQNPISNKMSAMRLSLWTGLLNTIIYNQNRQQNCIRIFETGFRFIPDIRENLGVCQDIILAGAACGKRYKEHWDLIKSNIDFYDVKGDLESILDLTGKLSEVEFHIEDIPALHPGKSAAIYLKDERIGLVGVIHPELEYKLNLKTQTIVFELYWKKITERVVPKAKDIPRFPVVRRDIAIVVAEDIPVADVLTECKKVSLDQIVDVNLFDIYRGKNISKGFKSLAISLIFQCTSIGYTLEEKEITSIVSKCVKALEERFQALLRH